MGTQTGHASKSETRPETTTEACERWQMPAVLSALPLSVAILDRGGTIRATNEAWQRSEPAWPAGSDFVRECESAGATALAAAIRNILNGSSPEQLTADVPVPGAAAPLRRFTASPFVENGLAGAVVSWIDCPAAEPTDEQARQAQKMEAVGRLVGGVAHDFANLLTTISGYSEIVLARMSSLDPVRPEVEEIRKAANRGSRLIAQLLGYTRSEPVAPRILDLNILIGDMEKMLRPIIGEHIEMTTALSRDLGKVRADPGQMEQVIMNLVLNARDAMPRGGRLSIATGNASLSEAEAAEHELPAGKYVQLTFADTGDGMDQAVMSHLFEPFFTTKQKGKGTGLGLSTVYGVIKQNQGDVWAASEPGKGSTFTIYLPRVDAATDAPEPNSGLRTAGAGHETILLVEDEEPVRRLLKHMLARLGYNVIEADNGEAALEAFQQNPGIKLLLTDMVMPRMSGRELAQQILNARPDMKVIYMSGYTDDVLVRTGALGPGMSFLAKPLKPETLATKVREVLDAPARAVSA